KVPILPDPEPFNNHTIKELPPTVQSFDPKYDLVYNSPNVFSPSLQPLIYSYEFCRNNAYYGQDCSLQVLFTYDPEPCYNQRILEDSVFNTRSEQIFLELFWEKSTSLTIMTINRVSTLRTVLRGSLGQVGSFIKITNDLVPKNPYRTKVVHSVQRSTRRTFFNRITRI
nr:hypothetical protein [Tanacetum cinerariifolium]